MFTEKLAATIGPSYVASFFLGGLIGLTKVPPAKSRRTKRLMINSYIKNVGPDWRSSSDPQRKVRSDQV